jgi:hypothetical protein
MKTLKNNKTGELKRVHDKEAQKLVLQTYLGWEYCPKNVWKAEMGPTKSTETKKVKDDTSSRKNDFGKTKKSTTR